MNLEPPSSRSSSSLSTAHRHRSRFVRARMRLFLELLRGRETNARDYQKKYIVRICMPSTINALTLEYFSSSFLVFLHQFSNLGKLTWKLHILIENKQEHTCVILFSTEYVIYIYISTTKISEQLNCRCIYTIYTSPYMYINLQLVE